MSRSKDPVCGMDVGENQAAGKSIYEGQSYYFCSTKCLKKFEANPAAFVSPIGSKILMAGPGAEIVREPASGEPPSPSADNEAPGDVVYTCPMHPQIKQDHPGTCPLCGMALEPRTPRFEENAELLDMTRRFWVSVGLALPVFLLAMGSDLVPQMLRIVPMRVLEGVEFALATPAVLWSGFPIFRRGWDSLVNRRLNMFSLIALGVGVMWGYSTVAMLLPWMFPASMRQKGAVPVYFEAAAVITGLVLLGAWEISA